MLYGEPFDRTGAGRQRHREEEERPQKSFHGIDPEISGFSLKITGGRDLATREKERREGIIRKEAQRREIELAHRMERKRDFAEISEVPFSFLKICKIVI